VRANYLVYYGRHPYPSTASLTISVPPPDGFRLLGQDAVPTAWGRDVVYQFQVTCQGQDSIYFSASYAQEMNSNMKDGAGNPIRSGGSWIPTPAQRAAIAAGNLALRFGYQGMGKIADSMQVNYGRGLPAGTITTTFTQNFRIILLDPCGNESQPISLGSQKVTVGVAPGDPTKTTISHQ